MSASLILASTSKVRIEMLKNAGVPFEAVSARVDEEMLRAALHQENALPRDIADCLADAKAASVSRKHGGKLVLGADQVLSFNKYIINKSESAEEMTKHLRALSGQTHQLFSATVMYMDGSPVWRHIGTAKLTMRELSDEFIADYVVNGFEELRHSVGGYHIESTGSQLFSKIEGDYFSILGLPLIETLEFLRVRKVIKT